MPELVLVLPGGLARRVTLSQNPVTIGRSDACDLRLPSDEVSRVHAEVWLDESGRVLVADKRSKNGTRVDAGEPFRNAVRTAQRVIRIGEYEISVVGAAADTDDTPIRFQPDVPDRAGETNYFPSSRPLDFALSHRRLELLMGLTERIGGAFERKQLLEQALAACCEALEFERGMIVLKTPRGEPELPITRNVQRDETGAYTVSRTLINKALVHGECAVVNDLAVDLAGNITESLVRFPIRSALCVPILHRSEILGVIYGDRVTQAAKYREQDVAFLAAIAQQVGVGIANLRLVQEHLRAQKIYLELEQARAIQRRLFPPGALERGPHILAGHNEPCDAVGGDYFDYFDLGTGHVGLIIADVVGHGLPAALIMANLKGAVRIALSADAPLADVATRLNRLVSSHNDASVYVTAIIGRLDLATGILEFVNAGHPGPVLLYDSRCGRISDGLAFALGMFPDTRFEVQRIDPSDGLEAVLFYTDGLVEASNTAGQMLDLDPVLQRLQTLPERTSATVLRSTLALVNRHLSGVKNADDLTLMVLQYAPSSPRAN